MHNEHIHGNLISLFLEANDEDFNLASERSLQWYLGIRI